MQSRLQVLAIAMALGALSPARAGDVASRDVIGFSANGGIFAFEEFGVQDGSGFPYANRFYIDTATDRFLPGSPVRVRIDDENANVDEARRQAREKGEAVTSEADFAGNPGYTAGANGIGEWSADPSRMIVNPRPVFPAIDAPLEFRIDAVPAPPEPRCGGTEELRALRVWRVRIGVGAAVELIHDDKGRIPTSRGCPTGYRIAEVRTFFPDGGPAVYALTLAVEGIGFEGPDYRHIALTGLIEP
ncbi:MAG: DUF2259 domain-containing protein [Rhizobiaceae bacterium]